jgi:hypothetical protein
MKSIISQLATSRPDLSVDEFAKVYSTTHPQGGNLTPDNIRQAFAAFNKYCRKARTNRKAQQARK